MLSLLTSANSFQDCLSVKQPYTSTSNSIFPSENCNCNLRVATVECPPRTIGLHSISVSKAAYLVTRWCATAPGDKALEIDIGPLQTYRCSVLPAHIAESLSHPPWLRNPFDFLFLPSQRWYSTSNRSPNILPPGITSLRMSITKAQHGSGDPVSNHNPIVIRELIRARFGTRVQRSVLCQPLASHH